MEKISLFVLKKICIFNLIKMSETSDTMSITVVNINDIIDEDAWEYLRVEPYPFSNIELNKNYFEDKEVIVLDKHTGPALARSGDSSTCHFCKIENESVYFYIMDDPGYSGYGCCGVIKLYYSDSIDIVKKNM